MSANPAFLVIWLSAENKPQYRCYNPGLNVTITYGALDPYGGYASGTFTREGVLNKTFGINENSPAGTLVGSPVTGTPYDDGDDETDDSLTYTLTWDTGQEVAEGLFDIDAGHRPDQRGRGRQPGLRVRDNLLNRQGEMDRKWRRGRR